MAIHFRWIIKGLVSAICLTIASLSFSQQLRIAKTFEKECSAFYNGVATIGDEYDDCYYIDRWGNNIGKAPGKLIFANKNNRVFESEYNIINREFSKEPMFITDANDNIISERYYKIEEFGGFFFCEKYDSKSKDIVNSYGEVVLRWEGNYFYTFGNSDFIEITDPDYSKHKLFYKGKILFEDRGIKRYTFENNWPFVLSNRYAYNKRTGKLIDHHSKFLTCAPYIDFYIISDSIGNSTYYDYNDNPIDISKLVMSSKGVRISMDSETHYVLVDKNNQSMKGMIFDNIDPYLWQSDYLAVKRNGKWGYVKSDGTMYVNCTLDFAGSVIMGHSYIEVSEENVKSGLLDIASRKYDGISDVPLKSCFFNKVDNECLFYYEMDTEKSNRYGFRNLSGGGMKGTIYYPEFIDGFSLSHYYDEKDLQYIAFNLKADAVIRADKGLKRIGKNIFVGIVSEEYNNILFNEKGDTLVDLSKSKLRIEGPQCLGLIPFSSPGGYIKYNGKKHGYGYLYDTFSQSYEQAIAQYGILGSVSETENADKFLAERIDLMDYYQILGNRALDNGNYNRAIDYFDKMIDLYTVNPTAYFGKGIAYINLGDYETALKMLKGDNMPKGTDYAKAVCYFNMGNLDAARRCCSYIDHDDPTYDEAFQMRKEILKIRQNKSKPKMSGWDKAIAILGVISNGLQLFSQSMGVVQTPQQTYATPSPSYNASITSGSSSRRPCDACHGTRFNSAKERAAFYSYSEETYSNSPCEVCGDRDSHYHKPCLVCQGRGYVNY